MNIQVFIVAKIVLDKLTDLELAAINNAVQTEIDPKKVMGYEKAKFLFTEDDGKKMHSEMLAALSRIVLERLQV